MADLETERDQGQIGAHVTPGAARFGVGKRTLAQQLPATAPTTLVTTPMPQGDARIPFTIDLPDGLRDQITGIYAQYVATGKVLALDGVRYQLHVLGLRAVNDKLSDAQLERLIPGRTITHGDSTEENDGQLLAWLVGLPALPAWKKGLPKRVAMSWRSMRFSAAEVKELRGDVEQAPEIPEVTTVGGILSWGWGVVMGDFNEEADLGQITVNALLGLIPVVDQVLDVRDIVANLYFLIGQSRYDEFGPWFGLVVTVVGCIPEIGSAVKGVVKALRKVGKYVPVDALLGVAKISKDAIAGLRPFLKTFLDSFAAYGVRAIAKIRTLLGGALELFRGKLAKLIGSVSEAAKRYFEALIERTTRALQQLDAMVRQALAEIRTRLTDLYDDLFGVQKKADLPVSKTDDVSTTTKTSKTKPTKTETKPTKTETKPAKTETSNKLETKPDKPKPELGNKWWEHPDKYPLELDAKNFREVPTQLGDGSLADVFKHKDKYAIKTIQSGGMFSSLSDALASKLWERIANLNEEANQILGKGVVPKSRAFGPVTTDGVKQARPVLVQELVKGLPIESIPARDYEKYRALVDDYVHTLAKAKGMPVFDGMTKYDRFVVDPNPANFVVVDYGKKTERLVWFDPFFPPDPDKILANPAILD